MLFFFILFYCQLEVRELGRLRKEEAKFTLLINIDILVTFLRTLLIYILLNYQILEMEKINMCDNIHRSVYACRYAF